MKTINCLDLKGQQQQVKAEIFELYDKVYDDCAFAGGKYVEEFEKQFASYCGVKYSVGLSNGTVALHLAMIALGVEAGDEVIIPANTFIATAWGPSHVGATPVFVDCNDDNWEINASKIEAAITSKTKGVIGVHLYGQPFDVDAVQKICDKHNIFLMEDAAQAQGSLYHNRKAGSLTKLATFSFYPGKNLGATGEAGCITTDDEAIYNRLLSLRNHGMKVRYYHDEIGFNYRMGGLEGASLTIKLKYLDQWNAKRRFYANKYQTQISNPKIKLQSQPEWAVSNYHLFVAITENRDDLIKYLAEKGINVGLHYPVPCHLQKAYSGLSYKIGSMPTSEYLAEHCVSLPMYAELKVEEVDYVINTLNQY